MSEIIKTIDLTNNTAITDRNIVVSVSIYGIDINQVNGTYAVVEPYNIDGSYNGEVVIYPQSTVSAINTPIYLKTFNRVGSLYYPLDAKFDYIRRKIWIADTGNNRVLKISLDNNQVDVTIDSGIIYPHALAVDLNTGNIFIKGYESNDLGRGAIFYYQKDGTLLSVFSFGSNAAQSSSSSNSSSSSSIAWSMSSSSSSGKGVIPSLPSNRSIAFDHMKSRLWWVNDSIIYMLDVRNKQIQTYDINKDNFEEAICINLELSTGNAFVVASDFHKDRFLLQINRDNNTLLGTAYIQKEGEIFSSSSSSFSSDSSSSSSSRNLSQSSFSISLSSSSSSDHILSRIISLPLINQNNGDIIPFTWIAEKGIEGDAGDNSVVNFTVESSSSPYFDYSAIINRDNSAITSVPIIPTVYVPNSYESKYKQENSFYIDVIAKDSSGIKEIRTHVGKEKYEFKDIIPEQTFFIPKFTWR